MYVLIILALTFLFFSIFLLRKLSNKELKKLSLRDQPRIHQRRFQRTRALLIWNIAVSITLLLVFSGFEWKTNGPNKAIDLNDKTGIFEDPPTPPRTIHKLPPKPKKVRPKIVEVPDQEQITEDIDIRMDPDDDLRTPDVEIIDIDDEPEQIEVPFILVPEVMPEPKDGLAGFMRYLSKNIKYPEKARRMGVEGRVFVEFIIDKNGKLSNFKVVKGIGSGCDEEAVRVLKKAPNWNPGLQRGRAVPVKMTLPISFKLG